jgi:hypothetical protein
MLNSAFFSTACWGVASQQVGQGLDFFALALVVSVTPATPFLQRWARIVLAGLAVGMNFNEAADIGALFSICVAAFIVYRAWAVSDTLRVALARGMETLIVVTACAIFIAAQGLIGTFQTQIKGVVGTQQDEASKAAHWDFATMWSFPKMETLGLFMPGLFGYRLVPMSMEGGAPVRDGSDYWGEIGRAQAWDRYFDGGKQGSPPNGMQLRQVGGGNYAGVLVTLVALWAALQSLRKKDSVFPLVERRLIWFWLGVAAVSLLLAFGRYAPFYQLVYALPYLSTMRNPTKYLYLLSFGLVILFAYGVDGLIRRYVEPAPAGVSGGSNRTKSGWAGASIFDRRWTIGCFIAIAISLLGWGIYAGSRQSLEKYLDTVAPFGGSSSMDIADFSISQPGWFVLYLAASVTVITLIIRGTLAGRRARWAGILLGLVLVADLGRADLPWVIYWNYHDKYETQNLNPIVRFLAKDPYEHRVAVLPSWLPMAFPVPQQMAEAEQFFDNLYDIEWKQHLFLYYNIQTLDVIQMPRVAQDLEAYERVFLPRTRESVNVVPRHWELTNTRYLLGAADWLEVLNQGLDPAQQRFKILQRFNVILKPGLTNFAKLSDITAVADTNGTYALFDFAGALPRARLYTRWQVSTNEQEILTELTAGSFNPHETVLVTGPAPAPAAPVPNQNPGAVEFSSYAPSHVVLKARAEAPSILLINDKYDPNWKVSVDGQPAELLHCNFIMRGVYLPPGQHTVDLQFSVFVKPLYVSIAANVLGVLLIGIVLFGKKESTPADESVSGRPPPKNPAKR